MTTEQPGRAIVSPGAAFVQAPATDDHEDICTFCSEVKGDDTLNLFLDEGITPEQYILLDTDHWVVFPCIGALTDYYVLIISKRHALSVGWLEAAAQAELRDVVMPRVQRELKAHSGHDVIFFEHGSLNFRDKGGACFDHAHVHAVATERPMAGFLPHVADSVDLVPCGDWVTAATDMVQARQVAYLALSDGHHHLVGEAVQGRVRSQFFRRALTAWLGNGEDWDWYVNRQLPRVRTMAQGHW
ncbi:MAG TPA: HIT domain protein [Candidatus Saccharimonadia bacterium]